MFTPCPLAVRTESFSARQDCTHSIILFLIISNFRAISQYYPQQFVKPEEPDEAPLELCGNRRSPARTTASIFIFHSLKRVYPLFIMCHFKLNSQPISIAFTQGLILFTSGLRADLCAVSSLASRSSSSSLRRGRPTGGARWLKMSFMPVPTAIRAGCES